MAFDALEPIGDRRGDLQAGIIASTVANANRGKGAKAFRPDEFMPKFDAPSAEQNETLAGQARKAFGRKLKRGGG